MFFVTNASKWDIQDDPGPACPDFLAEGKGRDTWEIVLKNGMGSWTGLFPNGGVLAVDSAGNGGGTGVDFDVGVSGRLQARQCGRGTTARAGGCSGSWSVEGLTPSTNYTAYVLTDSTKVSGPIYFATKSAAFTCPLVHSLPYCPSVSYAVPLPPPPRSNSDSDTYTDAAGTLPSTMTTPLLSYLANFTTVLTTHACGRDWYSPVVGCDDCQKAYRAWLCAISFVRCSEASTTSPSPSTITSSAQKNRQGRGQGQQAQLPVSALLPQPPSAPRRNPFLPSSDTQYTALLPCIEQCYVVDRACPPFLGFKCPSVGVNDHVGAKASYGVGFIDGEDGDEGAGRTGGDRDQYGNVWCNLV